MEKKDIFSLVVSILFIGLLFFSIYSMIEEDNKCQRKCNNLDAITFEKLYSEQQASYVCVCYFDNSIKTINLED